MIGKILGAGAIRGEDGARYYYDEGEIKNLKDGQSLEGCEVDFDIKDGKAIAIYITSESKGKTNVEPNSNQTGNISLQNSLSQVQTFTINRATKGEFFKGKVSAKEIISNSSQTGRSNRVFDNTIHTIHNYSTYFNVGNKSFVWKGNNPIDNGDEVAVYAESEIDGRYKVECLRNITRGLFFEKDFVGYIWGIAFCGFIAYMRMGELSNLAKLLIIICVALTFAIIQVKRIPFMFKFLFVFIVPFIFMYLFASIVDRVDMESLLFYVGCFVGLVILQCIKEIVTTIAINKAVKEYE